MSQKKPLDGLSFCCTGILAHIREDLAEKIGTLGGQHSSDLMSDVHYLVVGDRATAKYQFSIKKRHDIKFVLASTITSIYDLWLKGEPEDSKHLKIDNSLMTVFHDQNICFSRIEFSSGELRKLFSKDSFRYRALKNLNIKVEDFLTGKSLMEVIQKHGGQSTESLTQANTCVVTTEKVGRRYTKALEWQKPVVHPIWIFDSVLRGSLLDFGDYSIGSAYNGCEVWDEIIGLKVKPQVEEPKKKIQKSTEIWDSIMDNKQSTKKVVRSSVWDEEEEKEEEVIIGLGSSALKPKEDIHEPKNQLFSGFNFLLIGFSSHEAALLSKVIENHEGELTSDTSDDTITHVMLPAEKGAQSSSMLRIMSPAMKAKISSGEIKAVTEWFVERSMFYKRAILDRWGQPMKGLVPSTKKFKVCITGFTGIEMLHVEKLIRYLNFEFCESLTSKRDLLVININLFKTSLTKNSPRLFQYKFPDIINCPTYQQGSASVAVLSSKNKINAAKKWQIPIVSVAYLWEIIELSTSKPLQTMPNIMDLTWCLFAPNNFSRPKTLLEYVKKMGGDHLSGSSSGADEATEKEINNDSPKRSQESDSMRLPSPRKAAKRQKYGRLAGSGESQSLTTRLQSAQENPNTNHNEDEDRMNFDITNDDDDVMTQVGYQNTESALNDEELLKKLGEDGSREQPARRPREVKKPTKYTR